MQTYTYIFGLFVFFETAALGLVAYFRICWFRSSTKQRRCFVFMVRARKRKFSKIV